MSSINVVVVYNQCILHIYTVWCNGQYGLSVADQTLVPVHCIYSYHISSIKRLHGHLFFPNASSRKILTKNIKFKTRTWTHNISIAKVTAQQQHAISTTSWSQCYFVPMQCLLAIWLLLDHKSRVWLLNSMVSRSRTVHMKSYSVKFIVNF